MGENQDISNMKTAMEEKAIVLFNALLKDDEQLLDFAESNPHRTHQYIKALAESQNQDSKDLFHRVMTRPNFVWQMAYKMYGDVLITLIKGQDEQTQKDIIRADGARMGLLSDGQSKGVLEIEARWSADVSNDQEPSL